MLQVNDLDNEMTKLMVLGTMNVVSFELHNNTLFIGKRVSEKHAAHNYFGCLYKQFGVDD